MRKAFVITIALAGIVLILARLLTDAALAADDNWEFIEALGASVLFPAPNLATQFGLELTNASVSLRKAARSAPR